VLFTDIARTTGWNKLADVLARLNNRIETITDRERTANRYYRIVTPRQP